MKEVHTETLGKIMFDEFVEIMKSDNGMLDKNDPT